MVSCEACGLETAILGGSLCWSCWKFGTPKHRRRIGASLTTKPSDGFAVDTYLCNHCGWPISKDLSDKNDGKCLDCNHGRKCSCGWQMLEGEPTWVNCRAGASLAGPIHPIAITGAVVAAKVEAPVLVPPTVPTGRRICYWCRGALAVEIRHDVPTCAACASKGRK